MLGASLGLPIPAVGDVTIEGKLKQILNLSSSETGARQLSGITYAGGQQYYVVGDSDAAVYPLTIKLESETGRARSVELGSPIRLSEGRDLEGIAYHSDRETLFVVDEEPQLDLTAIREVAIPTGSILQTIAVPRVYRRFRDNFGLESLTFQDAGRFLWTANEETLKGDGPLSSPSKGARVRLQRFNSAMEPSGQFVYEVDPLSGTSPFIDLERRGLVDLAALSDGRLLALERELGGTIPAFRYGIYLVAISEATDVSGIEALERSYDWRSARKTLLWKKTVGLQHNFEGMAIGEPIGSGRHALLLVSDDGSGLTQAIWPLVLSGIPNLTTSRGGADDN